MLEVIDLETVACLGNDECGETCQTPVTGSRALPSKDW